MVKESERIEQLSLFFTGFPGDASGKEPACSSRRQKRLRFNPWVGKILWRRKWQPTAVVLPGKFRGQRSLVGYIRAATESQTRPSIRTHMQKSGSLCVYVFGKIFLDF